MSFLVQSYRAGDTLTNGDLLYKCKLPLQKVNFCVFQASPLFAVSKNHLLKLILMPERHNLVWHILLSYIFIHFFFCALKVFYICRTYEMYSLCVYVCNLSVATIMLKVMLCLSYYKYIYTHTYIYINVN